MGDPFLFSALNWLLVLGRVLSEFPINTFAPHYLRWLSLSNLFNKMGFDSVSPISRFVWILVQNRKLYMAIFSPIHKTRKKKHFPAQKAHYSAVHILPTKKKPSCQKKKSQFQVVEGSGNETSRAQKKGSWNQTLNKLVVEVTHLKNMSVKLDHFPNFRGENKKYLKSLPSQLMAYLPIHTVDGSEIRRSPVAVGSSSH